MNDPLLESQENLPNEAIRKLILNKETVQELSDSELDDVAGGALGTGGGKCRAQSLAPACPGLTSPCDTSTCQSCNIYCG